MKRSLLLLLCIATLGLASCKKETIIQETPNRTFEYTIQPSQWTSNSNGLNFTAELDIPEIDQITLDDEGVLVYMDHPTIAGSQIALPFVYDTNSYTFEIFNGGIAIDIQSSDKQATAPVRPTKPVKVKILVLPSQFVP